ncbi:unnamed protein product, partial [Prorocentrum cordatum]
GLVAPGGIRFASPSLAERQCLQFLAEKYKLKPEFVHFKCVWLLHIAVAITGMTPARVPIHGPSGAAGGESDGFVLGSLNQPCLLKRFERGVSNGRITPLGKFARKRGQFAAGLHSPVPDLSPTTLAHRVAALFPNGSLASEDAFRVWVFYDLVFRFFADIAGFEAFLEVT